MPPSRASDPPSRASDPPPVATPGSVAGPSALVTPPGGQPLGDAVVGAAEAGTAPPAVVWTLLERQVSSAGAASASVYDLARRWARNDGGIGTATTPSASPATPAGPLTPAAAARALPPLPPANRPRAGTPPPVEAVPPAEGHKPAAEALLRSHRARWAACKASRRRAWAANVERSAARLRALTAAGRQ